ncbi:MAG: ComF family protein [bacterium]|nr:ComF family protein [bacterium]
MSLVSAISKTILDLIFPKRCLGDCGCYDVWICSACLQAIRRPLTECPSCRRTQKTNIVCPECRDASPIAGLTVASDYQVRIVEQAIRAMKYQYVEEIAEVLGACVAQALSEETTVRTWKKPVVIPVPLHRTRKNERGFNQAELLSRVIARQLDFPLRTDILRRSAATMAQATLDRSARLHNVVNAFTVRKRVELSDKPVILVDDVATTTATLRACAKELKKSGAGPVWGAVIARSHQ